MSANPDKLVAEIAAHYKAILSLIGEDPTREGLKDTPMRAAKALVHSVSGYYSNIDETVHEALFEANSSNIIIIKDIEFFSLCEHHILPFFGHISIGYIPKGKILGISKFARIVELFARRLQIQENLTAQVCAAICDVVGSSDVIVVCRAKHLCMQMRGVEKQDAETVTIETSGLFKENPAMREDFFKLLS